MRVRFVRNDTPFRRGEEKECSPAEARKFERQGVAEILGHAGETVKAPKRKAKKKADAKK